VKLERRILPLLVVLLTAIMTGCGTMSRSLPARTAQEQLLISAAADRALARVDLAPVEGKNVFVDQTFLEAYDAPYVVGKLRNAVSFYGGRLVKADENPDIIVEPRSGGLSINETGFLLGIPSIPIFFLGTGVETPELPFFKFERQKGIAKVSVFGYKADNRQLLFSSGVRMGSSRATSYWIFLIGPLTFDNLPKLPKETSGYVYTLEERPPPAD